MSSSHPPPPTIISVEEFFCDNPNNTPWKPLPEHDLKQSKSLPSYYRCKELSQYKTPFYYCKLHPDIENVYLETIYRTPLQIF